ncbi:hypothetical protein HDV06_000357 [Boothiomyces sp. JEL0866]|nr:hypothetical protein HDV06_000357 [Boothiomyces sp. JEL0866]
MKVSDIDRNQEVENSWWLKGLFLFGWAQFIYKPIGILISIANVWNIYQTYPALLAKCTDYCQSQIGPKPNLTLILFCFAVSTIFAIALYIYNAYSAKRAIPTDEYTDIAWSPYATTTFCLIYNNYVKWNSFEAETPWEKFRMIKIYGFFKKKWWYRLGDALVVVFNIAGTLQSTKLEYFFQIPSLPFSKLIPTSIFGLLIPPSFVGHLKFYTFDAMLFLQVCDFGVAVLLSPIVLWKVGKLDNDVLYKKFEEEVHFAHDRKVSRLKPILAVIGRSFYN